MLKLIWIGGALGGMVIALRGLYHSLDRVIAGDVSNGTVAGLTVSAGLTLLLLGVLAIYFGKIERVGK